jgi:hypothetical protein
MPASTPARSSRGRKRAPRQGTPRAPMTGISAGNPFEAYSRLHTGHDETYGGFVDLRRNLPPAYEMKVPHRVTVWPESTPASSARAASFGR